MLPKAEFADAHIHDVHGSEWVAWMPILVLIVVLGFFPEHRVPRHRPSGHARSTHRSDSMTGAR